MTRDARPPSPFFAALWSREVWRRAAPIGFAVGCGQAALNQGDHWFHGHITTGIIIKTIISPLIGLAVSIFSAAAARSRQTATRSLP